jgi:hypothetical protein
VSEHPWGQVLAELHLCSGPPVRGFTFVCANRADNKTTWACTGGQHVAPGQWIRCTCDCHQHPFDPSQVVHALNSGPLTGGIIWPPRGPSL